MKLCFEKEFVDFQSRNKNLDDQAATKIMKFDKFSPRGGKLYSFSDPTQKRLVKNVALCYAKTLISANALATRCFDRVVKGIDLRLTVRIIDL